MKETEQLRNLMESLEPDQVSWKSLADGAFAQLKQYSQERFPAVYADADEFLGDWFQDLPWNSREQLNALQWILSQPEIREVASAWSSKYNYDIVGELTGELQNIKNEFGESKVTEAPIRTMNGKRDIQPYEFNTATIDELRNYYEMIKGMRTAHGHYSAKNRSFSEWLAETANRFGLDR